MSIPMCTPNQNSGPAAARHASEHQTIAAHGKVILAGEHAVVYGQPAVVAPLGRLTTVAVIQPIDGPNAVECQLYRGPLTTLPDELRGLGQCITETIHRIGNRMDGHLVRITSTIPPNRGLGSSAAVAAAVVRGLYTHYGRVLDPSSLVELANIAERYAHGNPSGIDLEAVTTDKPLWFRKGHPSEPLHVSGSFHFVVADSGRTGDTRSAVAAVRTAMDMNREKLQGHMKQLGQIAHAVREALQIHHPQTLGILLNEAHAHLQEMGVSDAGLDRLVNAARATGALGAKLTGGGRGGCILVLARTLAHARALCSTLRTAGAQNCWAFTVSETPKPEP